MAHIDLTNSIALDSAASAHDPILSSGKPVGLPLRWLLLFALLHGLLYLVIVPPWQHYDEPTHFEYARLIALWGRQPAPGEIDPASNSEIADSWYRFRFKQSIPPPNLLSAQPAWIGMDEKVHPPLYYAIAAIPIRWVQYLAIETQLYATRLVSLCLYLLIIICAWQISAIVSQTQPLIQIAVPLLLILTPAFSDQMSAVNNDALVNFCSAALLLGCTLLIRNGIKPASLCLVLLSVMVGVFTKRTAIIGVFPAILAIFWAIRRRPIQWWIGGLILAATLLILSWGAFQYQAITTAGGTQYSISVRPWLAELDRNYLRLSIDKTLQSILSDQRNTAIYPLLFQVLFTTFWLRFGWGHVMMGSGWEYALLAIVLVGAAGLIVQGVRLRHMMALWQKRCIGLFIVTILTAWIAAIVRIHPLPAIEQALYIPTGRYIHIAILPTIWLLALGIQGLVPRRWQVYSISSLVLFFILLDTTAWVYTLGTFYYR